jgi:branched-chain amino acid aminotransferase
MSIVEVDYIWMDGELVKWREASVHVMTHCLHYGSGVFEGIRGYGADGELYVFRLEDHIDRLFESAGLYFMDIPYSKEELIGGTLDVLRGNEITENCYIRPLVYRGYGSFGLNPEGSPVRTSIIAFPFGKYIEAEEGAKCCISSWRRISPASLPPESKACGNYINSILAKMEAIKNGFDEAIFLDNQGFVSEGSGENLFLVKKDTVYTPPNFASILIGITRDSIIQLLEEMKYEVIKRQITRTELYSADEVFFTGTAAEITPVINIDHHPIETGKVGEVTKNLINRFTKIVTGKEERYKKWLHKVDP